MLVLQDLGIISLSIEKNVAFKYRRNSPSYRYRFTLPFLREIAFGR
jgi:hypothetical protein